METEKLRSLFATKFANILEIIEKRKYDSFLMGFCIGIFAPVASFLVYFYTQFSDKYSLSTFWNLIVKIQFLSPFISLSLLINLCIFFIFVWFKWDKTTKGIISATFIYGAIIVYLKF